MKQHTYIAIDLKSFYASVECRERGLDPEVYKRQAYAPEPVQEHRRVRRYQYEMMGVVYPQYAEKNILIDYGLIEESE